MDKPLAAKGVLLRASGAGTRPDLPDFGDYLSTLTQTVVAREQQLNSLNLFMVLDGRGGCQMGPWLGSGSV